MPRYFLYGLNAYEVFETICCGTLYCPPSRGGSCYAHALVVCVTERQYKIKDIEKNECICFYLLQIEDDNFFAVKCCLFCFC